MDNIIMTTKKTNTPYLIAGLIESFLYAGIAFYCLQLKADMIDAWRFSSAKTLNTCAIVLFIFAAINFFVLSLHYDSKGTSYSREAYGKPLPAFPSAGVGSVPGCV